mmetsp:Transcript_33741/g.73843  ORF Transcript_33741/g.73843 Transcript_33741/m.73843 type:complete len:300 (-) Transcript_33741:2140-3039(-)
MSGRAACAATQPQPALPGGLGPAKPSLALGASRQRGRRWVFVLLELPLHVAHEPHHLGVIGQLRLDGAAVKAQVSDADLQHAFDESLQAKDTHQALILGRRSERQERVLTVLRALLPLPDGLLNLHQRQAQFLEAHGTVKPLAHVHQIAHERPGFGQSDAKRGAGCQELGRSQPTAALLVAIFPQEVCHAPPSASEGMTKRHEKELSSTLLARHLHALLEEDVLMLQDPGLALSNSHEHGIELSILDGAAAIRVDKAQHCVGMLSKRRALKGHGLESLHELLDADVSVLRAVDEAEDVP